VSAEQVERALRAAFEARARAAVGEATVPPPPRFTDQLHPASAPHRRARWLAPLAAAAAVVAVVGTVLGLQGGGSQPHRPTGAAQRFATSAASSRSPHSSAAPAGLVHVTGSPADGQTVGVGMPIVVGFDTKITDARPFVRHTTVTVDGKPARGAWYFEYADRGAGHVMEAHYRLADYWPAHATIQVRFALAGVSAGRGLRFDGRLATLTFSTGSRTVATVDDSTHRISVDRDGKPVGSFPVSLGAAATPTMRGTKVIMSKTSSICVSGPGYAECGVHYAQRVSNSGEYLLAAPWNVYNIEHGIDSSNGCTNLTIAAAAQLYRLLHVGDVVRYPDASGPPMTAAQGYGDWNVPWSVWLRGGVLATQ
jgi:lipoprotein-anchoring transpeptidase ErfK/SrfK